MFFQNSKKLKFTLVIGIISICLFSFFGLDCLAISEDGLGWDYNLTKRCAKTTGSPGDENYYEDIMQCDNIGYRKLSTGSELQAGELTPDLGPFTRAYQINGLNSPANISCEQHTSDLGENWAINMSLDIAQHKEYANAWNSIGIGDDLKQCGFYTDPRDIITSVNMSHTNQLQGSIYPTCSRIMLLTTFYWDGKARHIELDVNETNWEDKDPNKEVTVSEKNLTFYGDNFDWVVINGPAFGYELPSTGEEQIITVDWAKILEWLFTHKNPDGEFYLDYPTNWVDTDTFGLNINIEMHGEVRSNTQITDIRINSKSEYGKITSIDIDNINPAVGDTVTVNYAVQNIGNEQGNIVVQYGPGYLPETFLFSDYSQQKIYNLASSQKVADSFSFVVGQDIYDKQQSGKEIVVMITTSHRNQDGNMRLGQVQYEDIAIHPTAEVGCTDTDGGQNIYEKGTTCTTFCKTDVCLSSTSLKEYYCSGSTMMSKTVTCANGCADGACAQESAVNHAPIGYLDIANESEIIGWAYDQNADSNPIDVHIYIDGNCVGSTTANQSRPDLVSAGVTPDPNHGFSFSTPSGLSVGKHTINVYAINQPKGTNPELNGSPMTFTVSTPIQCNTNNTDSFGKCSTSCGASTGCEGIAPNVCSLNLLKKCDSNCLEIYSCGDGICNCGETSENCLEDCPAQCLSAGSSCSINSDCCSNICNKNCCQQSCPIDNWYNTGDIYSCCDGSNKCACQNQKYRDYYCDTNGDCAYLITNTKTIKTDCHPDSNCQSNNNISDGTLIKTPNSFKIYIIINQKKKWISTPEVFETLRYQWTEITVIDKNELNLIPDYEDNLIRALNDYKVYLIVQGIKRHIPNPEIFLNYGFEWNDIKEVNQETINQYKTSLLIKESKKEEIYYLCSIRKIKRWLKSPEIFNSYNNKWEDIQVISKYEMDSYPTSNLIKLNQSNDVYLIEGNKKRLIKSVEEFERLGLDWGRVMEVGEGEWGWFGE